jgi:hypothetical protein
MTMNLRNTVMTVALAALAFTGCSRAEEDARKAVDRADRMVTAVKDRSIKVLPAETAALADSLAAAKQALAAKNYPAALTSATAVQGKAIEIANSLAGKSTEMSSSFMAFSGTLNDAVGQIRRRVSQLSRGPLPASIDKTAFNALKADLPSWEDTWKAATKEFQQGEFGAATARADSLKRKIAAADSLLGIK